MDCKGVNGCQISVAFGRQGLLSVIMASTHPHILTHSEDVLLAAATRWP